ncbi:hypothetical protein X975_02567, partial [Stegodyphus mimosarum]
KKYFDYLLKEAIKETKWYEKESRAQAHADVQIISFWLLKYDIALREEYLEKDRKEKEEEQRKR